MGDWPDQDYLRNKKATNNQATRKNDKWTIRNVERLNAVYSLTVHYVGLNVNHNMVVKAVISSNKIAWRQKVLFKYFDKLSKLIVNITIFTKAKHKQK